MLYHLSYGSTKTALGLEPPGNIATETRAKLRSSGHITTEPARFHAGSVDAHPAKNEGWTRLGIPGASVLHSGDESPEPEVNPAPLRPSG